MKITITDIQHFSVGDGEGIRTTVFFNGCNLRCPWCHNPETISKQPVTLCYKNIDRIEQKGKTVSTDEIFPELLEDKAFFDESGGGVTLSGGEVMLQSDGAAELSQKLADNGVSVLIDTAGCVAYEQFEKLNNIVSGYLFDYKSGNAEKCKNVIGANLDLITDNLARLLKTDRDIHIRIPLIPNFNTDEKSIDEICENLKAIGATAVELLPFHRLGSTKYEAMGLTYIYKNTPLLLKQELENIKKQYLKYFEVSIES